MERQVVQMDPRVTPWILQQIQKREVEENFAFYRMQKLEHVGAKNQQEPELLEMGVAYV